MRRKDTPENSSLMGSSKPPTQRSMVGISSNSIASGGIGKHTNSVKKNVPDIVEQKKRTAPIEESYQSGNVGYQSSYQSSYDESPSYNSSYSNTNSSRVGSMGGIGSNGHVGTIKKNYYQQAREQQNSGDNSPWLMHVITDMLKYIYESITHVSTNIPGRGRTGSSAANGDFPTPELILDSETKRRLEEFKTFALTHYDSENETHEKLLQQLWTVCMDDAVLKSRISEQWKQLGFQGTNPATDFRGSGVLGLTNLLYFANTYRTVFKKQFTRTVQSVNSYPFVIAGLNITMLLFNVLGWGIHSSKMHNLAARKKFIKLLENGTTHYGSTGELTSGAKRVSKRTVSQDDDNWGWGEDSPKPTVEGTLLDFGEDSPITQQPVPKKKKKKVTKKKIEYNVVFEEMYVAAFRILDEEWYRMNASYFNFPQVLDATRHRVESLLELRIDSLEDLKEMNAHGKYKK